MIRTDTPGPRASAWDGGWDRTVTTARLLLELVGLPPADHERHVTIVVPVTFF
jgi:hypothetical protein